MKNFNLALLKNPQKLIAFLIASLALLVASQATYYCLAMLFSEPELPNSLINKN